eukprot:CAMPEP_0195526378 /NCGR_PEP_ID=MMETSP0794_2-20130614/27416_1 /TAXON_ID=515487 /ORGANISM="Stephanopyxis turris, Strain CCMP 815" /LENGTH=255 /DNA_ID=CAMNT_0040657049 /DNA_START=143 /DNA_END=913 /DNA_ORIENTATION=+
MTTFTGLSPTSSGLFPATNNVIRTFSNQDSIRTIKTTNRLIRLSSRHNDNDRNQNEDDQSPPQQLLSLVAVEDTQLLFYDVILILNLSMSISFWVVHRLSFTHLASSLSEGSLLALLWIIAGLYHGSFLWSSIDGNPQNFSEDKNGESSIDSKKGSDASTESTVFSFSEKLYQLNNIDLFGLNEQRGPGGAGMLALRTFVTTANLRLLVALGTAVLGHRHVGDVDGEMLIPMEIGVGLILMSLWRALHSSVTLRL